MLKFILGLVVVLSLPIACVNPECGVGDECTGDDADSDAEPSECTGSDECGGGEVCDTSVCRTATCEEYIEELGFTCGDQNASAGCPVDSDTLTFPECFCRPGFAERGGSCQNLEELYQECCTCLADAFTPGIHCDSDDECSDDERCWCPSAADCVEGQCGDANVDGPECVCSNADCSTWVCGEVCLVGEVGQCVQALQNGGQIFVENNGCNAECVGSCFFLDF